MPFLIAMRLFRYQALVAGLVLFAGIQRHDSQEQHAFGEFIQARALSLDPRGNLYVADAGANSVQKFTPEGTFPARIGGYGWGQLEFDRPSDVCAANGLDVFVADYGNHRVQRFDRRLEYIATLYTRDSNDDLQRFGYPAGVAVNRFGDLLLCDQENHRLLKLSGFRRVVQSIGGIDAGKGRLVNPLQTEVGPNDNIYVLEQKRVVVFDNFGNYVRTLGSDTLRGAKGFTVSKSSVFIADSSAIRELSFDGRVVSTIPYEKLFGVGDRQCVDVAVDEERVILLFPQTAVILRR